MIRSAVRALLGQVAKRVARDGLFEQPGERGRAEVLKWEKEGGAEKAAELREAQPTVRRPATGCVPAGLEEARALLRPSGRSLVINHWATWCEPCVDELPRLVRAAAVLVVGGGGGQKGCPGGVCKLNSGGAAKKAE